MANGLTGEALIDQFACLAEELYIGAILRTGIVPVGVVVVTATATGKANGKPYGKAELRLLLQESRKRLRPKAMVPSHYHRLRHQGLDRLLQAVVRALELGSGPCFASVYLGRLIPSHARQCCNHCDKQHNT